MGESDFCKAIQAISIVGIRANLVPLTTRPELVLFFYYIMLTALPFPLLLHLPFFFPSLLS